MLTANTKKKLYENPDVTSVGWGFRVKDGKQTNEECIIVGVKRKMASIGVATGRLISARVEGFRTDVQERDIKAQGYFNRMRPCPPGFSIGHTSITAGTLGAYVGVDDMEGWAILSNNHVMSANQGKINDKIIQPGKADGGFSGSDHFAWLRKFVIINWDGDDGGGGCNITKRISAFLRQTRMIKQPYPNLVDAAFAGPVNQGYVKLEYPDGSILTDWASLRLGDAVKKTGRTTEWTSGLVVGVDTMVKVQYGTGIATFDDQVEIRADSTVEGDFSAPGDSGSVIIRIEDTKLGGLLFAGGSGVTIANRIEHVMDLLGITVTAPGGVSYGKWRERMI